MIYLIGGPPKCGKTTLAKVLSRVLHVPWIATDTLQSIARLYTPEEQWGEKFPYGVKKKQYGTDTDPIFENYEAEEIISWYRQAAESSFLALDTFVACELVDGNDYIIEGLHIEPAFVKNLEDAYGEENVRAVFLVKKDEKLFLENLEKSTTPNDWILNRTKKEETLPKIASMICDYGAWFEQKAVMFGYEVFEMDEDFEEKIERLVSFLH